MPRTILIADDEELVTITLEDHLKNAGFDVITAADGPAALEALKTKAPDALVTDVRMPGMDGLALLERAREIDPSMPVLVMTGYGAIDDAVRAMRAGAMDYLIKPVSGEEIRIRLSRAFDIAEINLQNRRLRDEVARLGGLGAPVVVSEKMKAVFANLERAAETQATVVLVGETGAGKEVCARYLHDHSPRRAGPFVAVACAALAPGVVESELFGHEKGAFTGAAVRRDGHIFAAQKGTLFLDDVDDVPMDVQAKLLRVLEHSSYARVGGTESLRADVRFVAATKRSLERLVAEGRFRDDLMYRLSVVQIEIPPLRERRDEIPALAEHFLKASLARMGRPKKSFSPEAIRALAGYRWPGNVRELAHLVESLVALHVGSVIEPDDLPARVLQSPSHPIFSLHLDGLEEIDFNSATADMENALIDWALKRAGGNQAKAAQLLHVARSTLQYRMGRAQGGKSGESDEERATPDSKQ
jgi:two-component system, NtrC family, response regulator